MATIVSDVQPAAPRLPRREVWVELPAEYAGLRVKLWVNFPQRLKAEVNSQETDRVRAALLQIVRAHNAWCDEEGEPYPPADEPGFWDAIPDELAAVVLVLIGREMRRLPLALTATG